MTSRTARVNSVTSVQTFFKDSIHELPPLPLYTALPTIEGQQIAGLVSIGAVFVPCAGQQQLHRAVLTFTAGLRIDWVLHCGCRK